MDPLLVAAGVAVPKGRGLSEDVGNIRSRLPDDAGQADAFRGSDVVVEEEEEEEEGGRQEAGQTVAGCRGGGHPVLLSCVYKTVEAVKVEEEEGEW